MILDDVRFERLTENDIDLMRNVIEIDGKEFLPHQILNFLTDSSVYAFGAKLNNKIIGAIYGYSLTRIDNEPMLYIHDVGILPEYQNLGIGNKFMKYVIDYAKENNFSKCFLITEKKNSPACKIYEKAGGKSENEDDIVYNFRF